LSDAAGGGRGAGGEGAGGDDNGAVRLFFAFVPVGAREPLAAAGARLALCAGARRVPPQNLHMTLAFVGEVPAARLPAVLDVGRSQRGVCCSIEFDAYEYWPKPEVVVAAARVIPTPLEALWRDVHADLARLGLVRTPKRLRPHVTLAHGVSLEPVLPVVAAISRWNLERFSLMRSEFRGAQRIYTVLDTWPLLYEPPP
jgi:2'-5' RNA ligase